MAAFCKHMRQVLQQFFFFFMSDGRILKRQFQAFLIPEQQIRLLKQIEKQYIFPAAFQKHA